jgi:hypothetical protein
VSETTPTRVVCYSLVSGAAVAVAEFRYSSGAEVSLVVHDPTWAAPAQDFLDRGVPSRTQRRLVTADQGAGFMGALLEPRLSTYYRFVDESD